MQVVLLAVCWCVRWCCSYKCQRIRTRQGLLLSFHSDWYFRGMDAAASILIFLRVQDSLF